MSNTFFQVMENHNYHVLFISSWFPSEQEPFSGNFVIRHAEAAAKYNKVSFANVSYAPLIDKANLSIIPEIKLFEKQIKPYRLKPVNFIRTLYYYWKLYKKINLEEGKIDIIHANVVFPSSHIALFIKIFTGIPYIISEHWTGYLSANKVKRPLYVKLLAALGASNASCLCPVTENLKEAMQNAGFKNSYKVIPNVLNRQHFFIADKAPDNDIKQIIHVSNLKNEHKNINGIIDVLARLCKVRQDFILKIISDGDIERVKDYALKKELPDNHVKFRKALSPAKLGEVFRASHFMVLFSNYENLPCVLIEAMACGIPAISTDVGGIKEHLTPDKGIIIEAKDESALEDAINHMLDHYEGYDREALHSYSANKFSYEAVGSSFSSLYKQVINKML